MTDVPWERVLAPWPLIGRAAITDRAVTALRGDVRTLVLSGESGVGKSRAVATVGSRLAAEGWLVLHASATAIMSSVPLGALLPLFSTDRTQLMEAASDPGTLFHRSVSALEALGSAPALLVLDDIGLLDPLSTTLVAQLVTTDLLRLATTIRTGDALPDPFLSGWSADRSLRIELDPLDVDAVQEALVAVLDGAVAHRTASEFHRATGGNPLYLRELTVGALDAGRLLREAGVWHLTGEPVGTPALRDLILARMAQLDPAERDVVERLAVCGELPVGQLRQPGARAALARLESAGIVAVGEQLTGRLAHPQYTGIIAASLSTLRTADLLLEQADILDESAPTDAAAALRSVTWRLAAGGEADPDILTGAALLAREAGDHRTVERLATAALVGAGPRADLHLLRGEAMLRRGRATEALEELRAGQALSPGGELATSLTAAVALAHISVHEGLGDALEVLRDADGAGAAPALALLRALVELYTNDPASAATTVEQVASMFGDSPAESAVVAAARALPLAALGRIDEAVLAAETALAFARATDGKAVPGHTVANQLLTLATVQLHGGLIDRARETATEALVEAIGADDEIVTRSIEFLLARIAVEAGHLETAERWYRDTMSGAMTVGPISLYIPGLAGLAISRALQGDAAGAARELGTIPDGVDTGPGGIVARAWIAATTGRLDEARPLLLEASREAASTGHHYLAGIYLHHLARLGAPDDAAGPLEALAVSSGSPLAALQARHARAEAAADGDALAGVGGEWSARGAHLFAAEAFASAARAARTRGAARLAVSLQARSDEAAARCEAPATPLVRFTQELTPLTRREREIAALASSGASSKEIAAKLFLSTRTVDNHLQSVYGKLGISGRHELVRRS